MVGAIKKSNLGWVVRIVDVTKTTENKMLTDYEIGYDAGQRGLSMEDAINKAQERYTPTGYAYVDTLHMNQIRSNVVNGYLDAEKEKAAV